MKMTVQNLGRIARAEFDVRPLTVFVGPNNTNKSWAAFALTEAYGASSFEADEARFSVRHDEADPETRAVETVEHATRGPGWGQTQSVIRRDSAASATHSVTLNETFASYLGVDAGLLAGCQIRAEFDAKDRAQPLFEELELTLRPIGALIEATATFSGNRRGTARRATFPKSHLHEYLLRQVGTLSNTLRWRTVTFPVERHLLLPYDAGTAERLQTLAGFQQPVRDFLRWVGQARAGIGQLAVQGDRELADLVERRVLRGGLAADTDTVEFTSAGVKVPVQAAASMVRSLAGLPLYLGRLARPGDALIVDEPEMNAHPRAQLALAELFALLANRGFNLVLTTHSPYIVDQLSVLMAGHRLGAAARERVASQLQLGTTEAFIDPGKIAVYEFAESDADPNRVDVRDVLDRDTGTLDASTFSRETDRIGRIVNAILDEEDSARVE